MSAQATVPKHIGFILDGNRRWAKANNFSKFEGHKRGYNQLREVTEAAFARGVKYVTAYVFSVENWNREQAEVNYLMELSYRIFTRNMRELHKKNIKICFLGEPDRVSPKILKAIGEIEDLTRKNTGGTLALCFNYGGRDEIVAAVQKLSAEGVPSDKITKEAIKSAMYSHALPDPDLIIRTSNEQRLSNFLLWGSAYAELYFTPVMWPEFGEDDLDKALAEYAHRQRRYGK